MNLIRNGGFELGSLQHWDMETTGSLATGTTAPHRGVYNAVLTSDGVGQQYFINKDYVPVTPYEIVRASAYVRSAAARTCKLYIIEYDSDLSVIATNQVASKAATVAELHLYGEQVMNADTAYVRIRCLVHGSLVDEVFYWDDINATSYNANETLANTLEILNVTTIIASDNLASTVWDMQGYTRYVADMRVYGVGGTNPTLDLLVYEATLQGQAVVVGTFAQATSNGMQRIGLNLPTGKEFYLGWTITGTNPTFNIWVSITGMR